MHFERLLLLWDELDELTGAIRHSCLHLAHGLSGLRQDLADWTSGWVGSSDLAPVEALTDSPSES